MSKNNESSHMDEDYGSFENVDSLHDMSVDNHRKENDDNSFDHHNASNVYDNKVEKTNPNKKDTEKDDNEYNKPKSLKSELKEMELRDENINDGYIDNEEKDFENDNRKVEPDREREKTDINIEDSIQKSRFADSPKQNNKTKNILSSSLQYDRDPPKNVASNNISYINSSRVIGSGPYNYQRKPSKMEEAETIFISLKKDIDNIVEIEEQSRQISNENDIDVLKKINSQLIKHLEKMNSIVNLVIDGSKIPVKYSKYNAKPIKSKPKSQKHSFLGEVDSNANRDKIIDAFRNEYEKTKARFDQVSDDNFVEGLYELNKALQDELDLETKQNKKAKVQQKITGNEFEKEMQISDNGTAHYDLRKLNLDFSGLKKTNENLQLRIAKNQQLEEENERRIEKLKDNTYKLEKIARENYNIMEIDEVIKEEVKEKQMKEKYDLVKRKSTVLDRVLKTNKKKYEDCITNNERKIHELERKKSEILEDKYKKNIYAINLSLQVKKLYSIANENLMPEYQRDEQKNQNYYSNQDDYGEVEEKIERSSIISEDLSQNNKLRNSIRSKKNILSGSNIETEFEIEKRTNEIKKNPINENASSKKSKIENGKTQQSRNNSVQLDNQLVNNADQPHTNINTNVNINSSINMNSYNDNLQEEQTVKSNVEDLKQTDKKKDKKPFKPEYRRADSSTGNLLNNSANLNSVEIKNVNSSTVLNKSIVSANSNGQRNEIKEKKKENDEINEDIEVEVTEEKKIDKDNIEVKNSDNRSVKQEDENQQNKEDENRINNPYVKETKKLFSKKKMNYKLAKKGSLGENDTNNENDDNIDSNKNIIDDEVNEKVDYKNDLVKEEKDNTALNRNDISSFVNKDASETNENNQKSSNLMDNNKDVHKEFEDLDEIALPD